MTLSHASRAENTDKNEYFWQDERGRNAPHCSPGLAGLSQGGDFTLRGHRLSSLYRAIDAKHAWLTNSDLPTSSCQKYSNSDATTGDADERTCA